MWHEDRLVRAVKALLDFDERESNPNGAEGEKLIHELRAAYFDLLTARVVMERELQIFAAAFQPHLRQREERFGTPITS